MNERRITKDERLPQSWTNGLRQVGRSRVTVEFSDFGTVASPQELGELIRFEVEKHVRSIDAPPIEDCNLHVDISEVRMSHRAGKIAARLSGRINGRNIDSVIQAVDFREHGTGHDIRRNRWISGAFINIFTFAARSVFPTSTVRALGDRRVSGRLVRALEDFYRRLRIEIDQAVGRKPGGGAERWAWYLKASFAGSLAAFTLCLAIYFIRWAHFADPLNAKFGIGLIVTGVFGTVSGFGLLTMPSRFYQSDPVGLRLIKQLGLTSLTGVRAVTLFLLMLSVVLFIAPRVYLFFINRPG